MQTVVSELSRQSGKTKKSARLLDVLEDVLGVWMGEKSVGRRKKTIKLSDQASRDDRGQSQEFGTGQMKLRPKRVKESRKEGRRRGHQPDFRKTIPNRSEGTRELEQRRGGSICYSRWP